MSIKKGFEKIKKEAKKELKNSATGERPEKKVERFIKLTPTKPTDIILWRKVIKKQFPDLLLPAEVGLSVVAQLLIKDITNPFALVYVDVPSSGKTITLNFFSFMQDLIYSTDNFTPASFVSHAANIKRDKLKENDLLPNIRYKTLLVRDLAPLFAKRDEDVQEAIGILIRVLDGEGLETNSGLYGKRGYIGDYLFMLMAASTPIRPRIWKVMGNLGSRLFFLNIDSREKSEEMLADQLLNSCKDKELECRKITSEFTKTLWHINKNGVDWNKNNDPKSLLKIIAHTAKLLARLRSSINVWTDSFGDKKYNHTQPIQEMPDRLNQLLYNLARGHALIYRRENISEKDLVIIFRVAIDSAPPNRSKIFKQLISSNGKLNTNDVMDTLKCSRATALKMMKEMELLNIVKTDGDMEDDTELTGRPIQNIILEKRFEWFLSEQYKKLTNTGADLVNKS